MGDLSRDLYTAIQVLRGKPVPEPHYPKRLPPRLPEVYAQPLLDWLLKCHADVGGAERGAELYATDPFDLMDEPDSVRSALAFARVLLGRDDLDGAADA